MNILLTCAGRRNYLVRYFKEALNGSGKVIAADASISSPALAEADIAIILPKIHHPDYISELQGVVEKHEVAAIISLNDLELPVLADYKERFKELGCIVLVSDKEVIQTCFDKLETIRFAKSLGLSAPKTFTDPDSVFKAVEIGEVDYPFVVKPRWGSASIGLEFPEDKTELNYAFQLLNYRLDRTILKDVSATDRKRAILIQEKIEGKEYSVDIINDLKGDHKAVIVKQKLAMRAGETDRATVAEHKLIHHSGRLIGKNLGHIGNLDADFFETEDGKVYLLEMNPRFGGGYPFSHEAGVDLPSAIVKWLKGEECRPEHLEAESGLTFSKYELLMKIQRG